MSNRQFEINLDRLKNEEVFTFDEESPPAFLDIEEEALKFTAPIVIKGKAYLTSDHLILNLSVSTKATLPCLICNEFFSMPIAIADFTHAEALAEIGNHIFNFTELLREAILLEVPSFMECNNGACPQRAVVAKYLKTAEPAKDKTQVYYPFDNFSMTDS
jgi:uncharacterized metal-binding protein YceD (DUF177 family)